MGNILEEICATKRDDLARRKLKVPESALNEQLQHCSKPRGFHQALKDAMPHGPALIAEMKRASPSGGLLRSDFDPARIALAYEQGGAACLSVLTDTPYFRGHNDDLMAAKAACRLPVLRKDFILETYQVLESRAIGADCILLIMAALADAQAKELCDYAHKLGMDVLVEVHDDEELDRALAHVPSTLIGINNRNLKTLETNLETSQYLRVHIPDDYTVVCESGIKKPADIARMQRANMHCFLVGEALMLQRNIMDATKTLLAPAV